jgi:ATP:ADP antiporter, AAA family
MSLMMVRESERKLVSRLLTFEFFQGAAIAIFYQVALSLFIHHTEHPTIELPKVFVISAFVLWFTGFLYHKLEHWLPIRKLVMVVLLVNTATIFVYSIFIPMESGSHPYLLYLFLASYNAIYLFNNLEFWGVASMLFDVRQSKRLFSIVSSGDIPAKLIGFLLVTVITLTHSFETDRLLWISLAFILASFLFYFPLMRLKEMQGIQSDHGHHHATEKLKKIQAMIAGDKLIRNLALVSFFSMCCLILVNYILYSKVKANFEDDTTLLISIGAFLVISRAATLVVKLTVTNRIVDKLGLKWALLITPLVLLLLTIIAGIYIPHTAERPLLYLFGMIAITVDVLHSAILLPVLLACMQPLPTLQRLRGHTLMKGFMDPFAFLAMGILLLLVVPHDGGMFYSIINGLLAVLTLFWIMLTFSVDREYVKTLTANLHDRTLQGVNISLTDATSIAVLLKRLDNGNAHDALSVLNLISSQEVDKKPFISRAIANPSHEVRKFALSMVTQDQTGQYLPLIRELLTREKDEEVLSQLIHTLAVMEPEEDLGAFLDHPHNEVAREAILSCLHQAGRPSGDKAVAILGFMLDSPDTEPRCDAMWVAGKWQNGNMTEQILSKMDDPDIRVRLAAFQAAAENRHPDLAEKLVYHLFQGDKGDEPLNAVIVAGDAVLPVLKRYLWSHRLQGDLSRKILSRLGRMEAEGVGQFLEDALAEFPDKSGLLFPVIFQRQHQKHLGDQEPYLRSIRENLHNAAILLYQIDHLQQQGEDPLLIRALELELDMIKEKCLGLFSFLYDSEKIRRARHGIATGSKEAFANALELIGMTIPPEFAAIFTLVYENSPVRDKCLHLQTKVHPPHLHDDALIKNILFDVGFSYDNWTKSCALYSLRNRKTGIQKEFIRPFTASDNEVLKETANYILALENH